MPLETAEQRGNEQEVVEKTTTQMYRAPEMVDLYLERELTEKVDVWVSGRFWPSVLASPDCCRLVVASCFCGISVLRRAARNAVVFAVGLVFRDECASSGVL